ncbi:Protein N-acetyltransferase, RimJ/RimL family [Mucilaginibacter lappiensis]|uniref:RimJ/RimL family protein N-acetyltransferase n=1 Tax=Mucilaginibacter lappiensis TaxID=354630 RepID=A0ABR6PT14_9SPHI|nr:GNAT family N-acetyltransferase [Mucilaginibacter lappiensis]MBB6112928.1 RimJ/RimL family protein N-acetyltransferase [Mucilaginibacter lappiensis]SIS09626.1 Protein N-acetyltransferase, RimJ/RimL family [Mucilaginibacter lappiensis]
MHTPLDDIITPRLILRLMSIDVVEACLAGNLRSAGRLLGASIPEELLEHTSSFQYGQRQLNNDPNYFPWSARAVILPEEQVMIGLIRFHSRPDPEYLHTYVRNAAELGYRIFKGYQRLRYATEAITAMMAWAQTEFGANKFVASVSPENIPSMQLVTRLGFTKIGEAMDDVDGMEYVLLYEAKS